MKYYLTIITIRNEIMNMIEDKTASGFNNPLWRSFHIPNDNITKRFKEVLKTYDNLPASFYFEDDIKASFGLPLLELKKTL